MCEMDNKRSREPYYSPIDDPHREYRENEPKRYRKNVMENYPSNDRNYIAKYNGNYHDRDDPDNFCDLKNLPNRKKFMEKRKKTEPCRNVNCHYNSSHCTFAHNLAELRALPCLADFCNRHDCKYIHPHKETYVQWVMRNKYDLVFKNRELSLKKDIEKNIKNISKDVDEFMAGIDFIPVKNPIKTVTEKDIPKNPTKTIEKIPIKTVTEKDIPKTVEKNPIKIVENPVSDKNITIKTDKEININLELKLKLEKYVLDIKEEFKDTNISADKIVCCAIELSREEYRPKKCLTVWCLNNVEKLGKRYCGECHAKIIKMASDI